MRRIHFSEDLGVNTVVFIDWQRKQGRAWEGSGEGKVPRVPLRSKQWSAPVWGNFSLRPCEQSCTLEWFPNTPSKNALGASTGTSPDLDWPDGSHHIARKIQSLSPFLSLSFWNEISTFQEESSFSSRKTVNRAWCKSQISSIYKLSSFFFC